MNHKYSLKEQMLTVLRFLQNHPKDYETCVDALKKLLRTSFPALSLEENPVTQEVENLDTSQIHFIICEYSGFSNEAIHMLVDAMIRNHDWEKLYAEIQENIEEEKGRETKAIPHLEMMRQGYRKDLGIETENIEYNSVTQSFLKKMRKIFNNNDNAFSAGALLALEGTAIAEFHILDKIIKEYDRRKGSGKVLSPEITLTNLYIDGHKDFEIGHEAHLRAAIQPYIHKGNIHKLVRGYIAVCSTMQIWWEQLILESYQLFTQDVLKFEDTELFEIEKVFLGGN